MLKLLWALYIDPEAKKKGIPSSNVGSQFGGQCSSIYLIY
jgi:hypothetical protein